MISLKMKRKEYVIVLVFLQNERFHGNRQTKNG